VLDSCWTLGCNSRAGNSDKARKRHQTRHLEFYTPGLLTEGLQIPRSIGVRSTFLPSLVGCMAEVHPPVLFL